ncbi:ABC transporter, permease protein 2 (cluster 1, maltose/g3p/polyamine/iron) [hydrothermal vent metagenome]|uniref:ABC transporter, permease protein 2 (Cluster 1, maltose/g3p/polyamine/iron) n=1 Tax=hydrothermal vent metagenome TaxID=652676 RepID=A0A3B0SKT9_9ZZZZ
MGWLVLGVLALTMVFPFVWSFSTSLQANETLLQVPPQLIPDSPSLDAYRELMEVIPFARMVVNSAIVTAIVVVLQVLTSALAGYGIARFRFRGRNVLLLLYIATLMVPFQVTIVPLFIGMSRLGWLNTLQALVLPMVASAFGVFLFRQYFMQMPRELEEAAALDGASPWRTFWSVAFPYARPAAATFGILAFMASWNSFLWPLFVARDEAAMTLPVGLASLHGRYQTDWNLVMAGSVIAVVPVIIAFAIVQRHISAGLLLGGVNK